ncbi:MAG: molybdopterin molybdenumtransferase MoeA, partial [Candidatus Hydrogenedentes bacterium]|nr:molybdopterin molybdenumtransferase MoeA [Candidatus Hydrogenedentota bacterium]
MKHLIDPDTAAALVLQHSHVARRETVSAYGAVGLTLAERISSDADYPPFDRSMMDGYSVCISDAGSVVTITGEVAAGGIAAQQVIAGTAIEIMTGAPCPAGTEAVVPKEDV